MTIMPRSGRKSTYARCPDFPSQLSAEDGQDGEVARLKKAFETHRTETEGHVERLSDVFEVIGKAPRCKTCDAILGILEEGKAVMEDYADSPALDAGLVASAQAVEHYEMTRYGTLRAWAQQLGHKQAVTSSTPRWPRRPRPTNC
jgi:ferritin-like metal-binding protein YciE